MCPKPSILSAYFDDELSRKKNAQLQDHLQHCSSCQTAFNNLLKLRETLRGDTPLGFESGSERFRLYALRSRFSRIVNRRSIAMPIPVVVAASVILFSMAVLNLLPRPSNNAIPQIAEASEAVTGNSLDSSLIFVSVSPSELEGILAIMEREISSNGQLATGLPQLSENMQFTRNGEPQFLRPVSYRGVAP